MSALLDFGDLKIERRTPYSKVCTYFKDKKVENFKEYCNEKYIDSIYNFFEGIIDKYAFHNCEELIKVVVPDETMSIGDHAFSFCERLVSFEMTDHVLYLGANAFDQCSNLKNIKLSDNLITLLPQTFSDCYRLENVDLPKNIQFIEACAFNSCQGLKTIVLPEGLDYIGDSAFSYCSLKGLKFPNSLNRIGYDAFYGNESLTTVDFSNCMPIIDGPIFRCCYKIKRITWKNKKFFRATKFNKVLKKNNLTKYDVWIKG